MPAASPHREMGAGIMTSTQYRGRRQPHRRCRLGLGNSSLVRWCANEDRSDSGQSPHMHMQRQFPDNALLRRRHVQEAAMPELSSERLDAFSRTAISQPSSPDATARACSPTATLRAASTAQLAAPSQVPGVLEVSSQRAVGACLLSQHEVRHGRTAGLTALRAAELGCGLQWATLRCCGCTTTQLSLQTV